MSRNKAALVLLAAMVAGTVISSIPGRPGEPWLWEEDTAVCFEDMDCWDWRTMGNGKRGGMN